MVCAHVLGQTQWWSLSTESPKNLACPSSMGLWNCQWTNWPWFIFLWFSVEVKLESVRKGRLDGEVQEVCPGLDLNATASFNVEFQPLPLNWQPVATRAATWLDRPFETTAWNQYRRITEFGQGRPKNAWLILSSSTTEFIYHYILLFFRTTKFREKMSNFESTYIRKK